MGAGGLLCSNPLVPFLLQLLQITYLEQSESVANSEHTSVESACNYIGIQKIRFFANQVTKLFTITPKSQKKDREIIKSDVWILFFFKKKFCCLRFWYQRREYELVSKKP